MRSGGGANHAFALGLGVAIAAAFSPSVWTIALVLLGGGALLGWLPARFGEGHEGLGTALRRLRDAAFALVVAPVVLFPWSSVALVHPRALVVGLGGPGGLAGAVGRAPGADGLVLLDPGGHDLAPAWFAVPVVLAALVGCVRASRGRYGFAAVAAASGAMGVGLVAARIGASPTGHPPQGWAGVGLGVAAALLLAAVLVAAHDSRRALRSSAFGLRQPLSALLAVLCAAVPLASGVWLVAHGTGGPLGRAAAPSLPINIVHAGETDAGQRVLWLREDQGRVAYSLEPVTGSHLGDEDQRGSTAEQVLLARLVADLSSDRGTDAAETLATYHVRYVALSTPGPLSDVLDQQPALSRAASPGSVQLWQVLVPSSRLEIVSQGVASTAMDPAPITAGLGRGPTLDAIATQPIVAVPSGPEGSRTTLPSGAGLRLLVLSSAVDSRWRATVDGHPLAPTTAWGWAQAFVLPPGGGALRVSYDQGPRHTGLWVELVAVLVVLVLAAPSVRRQDEEPDGPTASSLEPEEVWDLSDLVDDLRDGSDTGGGPMPPGTGPRGGLPPPRPADGAPVAARPRPGPGPGTEGSV